MTPEVRYESTATVYVEPPAVFSAPTAQVLSRAGAVLTSPAPEVDDVDTTVAAATSPTSFTAASGAGITPGRRYLFTAPGWSAIARVRSCVGASVVLTDALPDTPPDGTAVKGLDIAVPLSGAATAATGESFLVVVASGELRANLAYDVARYPFVGPVTADQVRLFLVDQVPNHPRVGDVVFHDRVAATCNARLRSRLRIADRYLDRYWDPATFDEPGALLLRLVMAEDHNVYASRLQDPAEFIRSTRFELRDRISEIIQSGGGYDADGDGVITDTEAEGFYTIVAGRG